LVVEITREMSALLDIRGVRWRPLVEHVGEGRRVVSLSGVEATSSRHGRPLDALARRPVVGRRQMLAVQSCDSPPPRT